MTVKELRQLNINERVGHKQGQPSLHYSKKFGYHWQRPPGPRKLPPSNEELHSRELFKVATQNLKLLTPEQLASLQGFTAGSAWTWKDMAISLSYGRSMIAYLPDGTVMKGARDMADEIQGLLDSLGSETGSLLVRSFDLWSTQRAGLNGYVYTSNGPGQVPTWQPPVGGGGGGAVATDWGQPDLLPAANISFTSGFLRVLPVWLPLGATIKTLKVYCTSAVATVKLIPVIYDMVSNLPHALIRKGPQITGSTVGINKLSFDTAWTVPATGLYYMGLQQTVAALPLAKGVLRPYVFIASTGAIPNPTTASSVSTTEACPWWLSNDA